MSILRLLLPVSLLLPGAAALLAQVPKPTAPGQTPPAGPENKPQPLSPAQTLLQTALTKLKQLQPLEVRFRFTSYFANANPLHQHGMCLTASDKDLKKVRYELHTTQGDLTCSSHVVSDGSRCWRWVNLDGKRNGLTFQKLDIDLALRDTAPVQRNDEINLRLRQELIQDLGGEGMLTPFQDLADRMDFEPTIDEGVITVPERGTVNVHVLRGVWNRKVMDKVAPAKSDKAAKDAPDEAALWAKRTTWAHYPRRCTVYLDKASGLPVRIEWFGPLLRDGEETLLLSQDYPVIRMAPSAEAEPKFVPTPEELKTVEFKTFTRDDWRAQLDIRKRFMQEEAKRLVEEEQARQRDQDTERDK
jgi:hypothetical protein